MPTVWTMEHNRRPRQAAPATSSFFRFFWWWGCVIGLLLPISAHAADRLVIVSPHWEGIRYEFGNGFKAHYQAETGRTVEIEWMDVGGTSEVLRFIKSEFKSKPEGINVDVFFGGGLDPYLELSRVDLLQSYPLPDTMLATIPPTVGGFPLYDPQYRWYGATIAGFGIMYNKRVLTLLGLPEPKIWEDLARPELYSWVGSADPRKSGSAHMPYEIILQAYGWERGWQIITAMGANMRGFTSAGGQTPKDVATGEVAYGLVIDFYAWTQINEVGPEMIGYIMPENLTIVNPDAIAILKGASNLSVAQSFLRFVLSKEGQQLWILKKGVPGGPVKFQLDRFSVLPALYDRMDPKQTSITINPFTWKSTFAYDSQKGATRWNVLNDLIGTVIIDPHKQLQTAWRHAIAAHSTDRVLPRLAAMPISDEESLALARDRWRDQEFRNRTLLAWGAYTHQKYGPGTSGIPVTDLVFLMTSLAVGGVLTGYLWRLNKKRSHVRTLER